MPMRGGTDFYNLGSRLDNYVRPCHKRIMPRERCALTCEIEPSTGHDLIRSLFNHEKMVVLAMSFSLKIAVVNRRENFLFVPSYKVRPIRFLRRIPIITTADKRLTAVNPCKNLAYCGSLEYTIRFLVRSRRFNSCSCRSSMVTSSKLLISSVSLTGFLSTNPFSFII